jgi:transketolase
VTLDISIDGDTAVAFTENVEQRYLAYGWQVLHVRDGDRLNLATLTWYPLSNLNVVT